MGKSYKKGVCSRCGFEGYVNDHHIVPKKVKKENNKETIRLCLDCHMAIHEALPDEPQGEEFYKSFTFKWLSGALLILLAIILGILNYPMA